MPTVLGQAFWFMEGRAQIGRSALSFKFRIMETSAIIDLPTNFSDYFPCDIFLACGR